MTVLNHEPGEAWTILCVDDEPHILSSLRRLLKPHGYQFLGANSAEEGIALLGTEKVDLIISDMRMPGMQVLEWFGCSQVPLSGDKKPGDANLRQARFTKIFGMHISVQPDAK